MKNRLIDIARRAEVSEATVSRVLNGRGGVKEETRQRVLEVARTLGRSSLSPMPSGHPRVGVLVPDVENPVFAAWLERIEAELFERGADALIAIRARTPQREADAFRRFLDAGVSGVIVVSGHHAQADGPTGHYREIISAGSSLVLINGVREDLEAAYISTDERESVRMVLQHLSDLGHRHVGLAVGDEHTWVVREKVQAFEEYAHRLGLKSVVAYTDFSYAGGYEAVRDLLPQGVSAIMCGSDVMARGALEGARACSVSVPDELTVVGYDDVPWASFTTPSLTTVRQGLPTMARAAARVALAGGESRRPERTELLVTPQLIVRGSSSAAPDVRGAHASPVSLVPRGADTMTM